MVQPFRVHYASLSKLRLSASLGVSLCQVGLFMKRKLCKLCFGNRKGSGVSQIFPLNFYTKDEVVHKSCIV